jgi:hypothetical protein
MVKLIAFREWQIKDVNRNLQERGFTETAKEMETREAE